VDGDFGAKIDARAVFEQDRAALLRLLNALSPHDWQRPTAAAPWVVRDVVAHLLGDDLARLARSRDGHRSGAPAPAEGFAAFINRLNDEWVRAAGRISPRLLTDLLAVTSPQVLAYWREADLDLTGEPVSWAGPDPAPVWLDCARDFTEYWVHEQQIREATGRTRGDDPEVVHTVLETFLRAMPHTLAAHGGPDGATFSVTVDGPGGGRWAWRRSDGRWRPSRPDGTSTAAVVAPDAEVLWRLCVRMIGPAEAWDRVRVAGEHALARAALQIVSIIR
jgi:uncharacterized protein (TIGR03083 family)